MEGEDIDRPLLPLNEIEEVEEEQEKNTIEKGCHAKIDEVSSTYEFDVF